jgi:hypothetical protein
VSIIIQNITDVPTSVGSNKYQVRINQKVIAEYYHNREDGLAECLRKAATAVEQPDRIEFKVDMEILNFITNLGR